MKLHVLLAIAALVVSFTVPAGSTNVSVTRRTTVRDSVDVVDDFYDIYG